MSDLQTDTVTRGDVRIDVRAPGSLVPERLQLLAAQASARVERLVREAGSTVRAGDLLVTLSNPDVQTRALEAEQRLGQAQLDLVALRNTLQLQALAQEALVAGLETQRVVALTAKRNADSLSARGFVSPVELANATALATEMTTRVRVERERLRIMQDAVQSQVEAQRAQVLHWEAIARTQRDRVASLDVRAPAEGVVQDLALQPGQWVPEGSLLARVVQPDRLKAVLRVAESDAPTVQVGQPVDVDTRIGLVRGVVQRKAPGAQAGVIAIDVSLTSALPQGAVSDLGVDGTVHTALLRNVLSLRRPPTASPNSIARLYRIAPGARFAERILVQFGRASGDRIEVLTGLAVGDRVILTDLPDHAAHDRVALR